MNTTLPDAIKRKGGGNGARAMLTTLKKKLSSESFERFLANTPDGDDFWPFYIKRKLTRDEPEKYTAEVFASDVLRSRS